MNDTPQESGDGSQPNAEIRAICFDAGDTLVFDEPPIQQRVADALAERGYRYESAALPGAVHEMLRRGLSLYLAVEPLDSPVLASECSRALLDALNLESSDRQAALLAQAFAAIPYERVLEPKAIPVLTELKRRGFLLAVISDWEADLPDVLRVLGVHHLLDCVSVSSLVGATKPDIRLFNHALDCLGVTGEQALHVGDYAELDVDGAHAAGMQAVLYDRRGLYRRSRHEHVIYAASLDELKSYLLGLTPPFGK